MNTIVVTLTIDQASHSFFTDLRTRYFPQKLNFLEAHLTLFHNLPFTQEILNTLESKARPLSRFVMLNKGIVSIGNGVAYKFESPQLEDLHADLQKELKHWLIPQDKQRIWPHITITNKVDPDFKNLVISDLKDRLYPLSVEAKGLTIFEYLKGPWKYVCEDAFYGE